MTLAPRLGVGLRQRAVLAPALRGSLSVLRMPLAELQAEIARELADNPFLRRHRGPRGEAELPLALAATETPLERLQAQIGLMPLAPEVRAVAEYLAGQLRDDGYLDGDPAELAETLGVAPALLAQGLTALQSCEPAGVGARSLAECLALQLADAGLAPSLATRVVADLPAFAACDWRRLARRLDLPRPELERIGALLSRLSARPQDPETAVAVPLHPDLVLQRGQDGAVQVRLGRATAPRLVLDRGLLRRAGPGEFADGCRDRARALIAGLRFRGQTLLRIGRHLAAHQHRFVAFGPDHLRPCSRAQLAEALGLHPSTVGRAVAGKAIAVEGRLFALATFFPPGLQRADGGTVANSVVRRRIAAIVAAEDPAAPLADEAIRDRLHAEGIDIARRTVAKYREALRLPTSRQRRRLARARAGHGPAQSGTGP